MFFPYEHYQTLDEPRTVYYPKGEETLALEIFQRIEKAGSALSHLLKRPFPDCEILVVAADDWPQVPHSESEEIVAPHPYWTDVTSPPSFVVPIEIDPIFGEITPEKFAFMLYHEVAVAFLEEDPRPWPAESPLWADEWQFKVLSLWLAQTLDGQQGLVNKDLREQYQEIFEVEPDGKTPVTIRGFDWFEDTSIEDYLCYQLLLEQFAVDLLARFDISFVPRFLERYRTEHGVLLSDDVTKMLEEALGLESSEWLEDLIYF